MRTLREAVNKLLRRLFRGPAACRMLARFGIDPKRFWLLMDLFDDLSERGEMLDELGRNGVAMKTAAWLYFILSAIMGIVMVAVQAHLATYLSTFLTMTGLVLLAVMLNEAGNSLVNPVEGLVLAHQPIPGATYTAAKLSHLARIVLYFVPGLNAAPALAGLFLKEARPYYPLEHIAAALIVGLLAALLCCAAFGWLIRVLPPRRVKAAGQIAGLLPFLALWAWGPIGKLIARIGVRHWLPAQPAARWGMEAALAAVAVAIVALGIRALSADYLIRVSGLVRGGGAPGARSRRSPLGDLAARFFGGQPSRAGVAYVSRMMLRDSQFRRQLIFLLPGLIVPVRLVYSGLRTDPFSGKFTAMHVMPHAIGALLCIVCSVLPYSGDYKGAWVFLLAPVGVFRGFARGVWALFWLGGVILPNLVLFPLLTWFWGPWHALLFTVYSVSVASGYMALDLKLVDAVPFTRPVDLTRGAAMMPIMILGSFAIAAAVGVQYFLVFRSTAIVALAALVLGAVAYLLTERSLNGLEAAMRYNLGLTSGESRLLYREIEA